MQAYQRDFIEFALANRVLQFGNFTLKSARESPYFFNSGRFNSGSSLARLGRSYAEAVRHAGVGFDMLYGAAYKGIPLVAATAIALANPNGGLPPRDVPYCFNRKEAKDHGEKGATVGAPLRGRVMIVDDVISAGTSVRESVTVIRAAGAEAAGVVIALDRQERGTGHVSAIRDVEREFGLKVVSIVSLDDIITYLEEKPEMREVLDRVRAYRARYGVVNANG